MALEESGFYYPNKMARIYIKAIEETIGPETMKAIFDMAGVPLELYPPQNNFAKEFDFAYYGAIGAILEQMYGPRGERGLAVYAGRLSFSKGLVAYGSVIGARDLVLKPIPLRVKAKIALKAIAETFTKFSDQLTSADEADDYFSVTIHRCPRCWGRTSQKPICYSAVGTIEGGLQWVSGGQVFQVEEVACIAMGDEACVFHIQKEPVK